MQVVTLAAVAAAALVCRGDAAHGVYRTPPADVAPDTTTAAATALFTSLRGQWACTGAWRMGDSLTCGRAVSPR